VCECEALQTRQDSWIEEVRTYVEHQETPMHALAALLKERGLGQARLGIEKKFLAADYVEELAAWLPHATILAADRIFDHARAIKASDEVDALRDAAVATEHAIRAAFEAARPGDTETKVSDDIASDWRAQPRTRRSLQALARCAHGDGCRSAPGRASLRSPPHRRARP
jgi:Xaa-Pro aminopeptidase